MATIVSPMTAQISDIREIGVRAGIHWFILAIPTLIAGPIGGAILEHGYRDMQIWCGTVMLAGAALYAVTRLTLTGPRLWVFV